ncbi:hypothetical protein EVAR_88017_1 [Eumeta japonica]|uniref:BED-type domain-containing protein n=1 Tax=Eumeta variegata TaxID=151549 RepID=A0A4C1VDU2_EUMVA|nr:hypothetical protein EVAR_88017_1 [Eumeta japonica]
MEEHSKRTSIVWNYFTAVDGTTATCDMCSMRLSYKSTVSNLKKHLNRKHPDAVRPERNNETASDQVSEEYYVVDTPTVKCELYLLQNTRYRRDYMIRHFVGVRP